MTALPLSTSDQFLGSAGDIGHWTVLNGALTNPGSGYGTIIPTAGAAFCYIYLPVPDYDSHGNPFCGAVATVADASALGSAYDVTVEPADYTGSVNFLGFITDTLTTGGTVTVTASPIAMTTGNTSIGMLIQIAPASGTFAGTEEFHISGPALSLFAPTPIDETGYCLTTLVDLGSNYTNHGIGQSPDGAYLYLARGTAIDRVHTAGWTVDSAWATVGCNMWGVGVDPSGNIYTLHSSGSGVQIAKTTPAAVVTDPWVTLAGTVTTPDGALGWGRDGILVVIAYLAGGATNAAYRVDLGGTVTHIAALDQATSAASYDFVAAASDGSVWVTLDPPPAGPNRNVNTTLRKYDPAGPTVTDIPIQALIDQPDDGSTEAYGGIFCDTADNVIVPMVTFQAGQHTWNTAPFTPEDVSGYTWTALAGCTVSGGTLDTGTIATPTAGVSTYTFGTASGLGLPAGRFVKAHTQIVIDTQPPTYTIELKLVDAASPSTVLVTTGPIAGHSGLQLQTPVYDNVTGLNVGLVIEVVSTGAPFAGTEPLPVFGVLFQVQDTLPDMSWCLKVTPSGAATRIDGTWSYVGSPPPDVRSFVPTNPSYEPTGANISDGPLNTSLTCEIDQGAGMSVDGKTLYFIDDGDQFHGVTGNLLRTLALCPVTGMLWLSDASPVGPANGLWTSGRRLHS